MRHMNIFWYKWINSLYESNSIVKLLKQHWFGYLKICNLFIRITLKSWMNKKKN